MPLTVGKKLGVFEISDLLGVGGMGEVYRARDTKLGREVAIKVLPAEFARDRDRLARFHREARLLAALNHPNIAHLHDLLEADGQHYLVLELVEGQTLADRISDGPLPLEDIYKLFGQVAEALETAHQQGVIHRDLKPANIKITDDGKVSVLDFGLAKATEIQRTATNDGVTSPWDDNSAGKSRVGQIVGTPAYMSPEQARGKVVDKRTDIWAYGCCLYEALTGQRSFRGETASDTLAMILAAEPDWKALPEGTPPRLRELLGLCLSKDLRGRLCDIGDARLELSQIASNPGTASAATALPAGAIMVRRSRLVAATIAGLLVASLAGAAVWNFMRPAVLPNQRLKIPQGVVRLTMELPPESAIANDPAGTRFGRTRFALSPDASRLVYTGGMAGESKLYLRRMDRLETSPLPGTDGAVSPFFSPDGQSVGFFASGKLKTIGVDGSRPVELCDAQNPAGASWGRDGMIYFAENFVSGSPANRGLMRIHDSGGVAELFTHSESDPKVIGHVFPCALPDGKSLVFSLANNVGTKQGYGDFSLAALSLKTGQWKVVLAHGFCAQYASTGHLVFFNDGWYYAARFDMNLIQVVGPRVPVLQSVFVPALSNTGCLVHGPQIAGGLPGGRRPTRPLVWVNRRGETERWKSPPRSYADLRLSPDGKRLAASVFDERGPDIWILDIERETDSPLTFEGLNTAPVWTPDGQRVIFRSRLGEKPNNLFTAPVDGSAPPQPLAPSDLDQGAPGSVSSDGRLLAFTTSGAVTGSDIYTLSLENGGAVKPLIQTEFIEAFPTFSPDGRWLAYQSDEKGRREVFVQPYPPTGAKRQVSDEGGSKPRWSAKGDEIFYRNGTKLYAVPIETEPAFKPGRPKLLFEKPFVETNTRTDYDVAPDGERFVFLELTAEEAARKPVHQLFVVQNWFEELERLAPPIAAEQSAR